MGLGCPTQAVGSALVLGYLDSTEGLRLDQTVLRAATEGGEFQTRAAQGNNDEWQERGGGPGCMELCGAHH